MERDTGITLGMYGELIGKSQGSDVQMVASFIDSNSQQASGQFIQHPLVSVAATTDPSDSQGLLFPDTSGFAIDMAITVPSGVNAGIYYIAAIPSATKVTLRVGVPQYRDGFNAPLSMTDVGVGFAHYTVESRSTALTSSVAVTAPLPGGLTSGVLGRLCTTTYVTFKGASQAVLAGDTLELYSTSPTEPQYRATVLRVFPDDVLELDLTITPGITAQWSFTASVPPLARLVVGHVADFEALSGAIAGALARPDAKLQHYREDLNRFINPLLVNQNPTDLDIGAAEQRVEDLTAIVGPIGSAITAYQPAHVAEIDQLIRTFKEKGADRAVDILLECRFQVFFGLTQDLTSYSGAFQQAVRDVARLDLPVHKTNRLAATQSPLRSSSQSVDYENESPDLDKTPIIDPPTDIDQTVS